MRMKSRAVETETSSETDRFARFDASRHLTSKGDVTLARVRRIVAAADALRNATAEDVRSVARERAPDWNLMDGLSNSD